MRKKSRSAESWARFVSAEEKGRSVVERLLTEKGVNDIDFTELTAHIDIFATGKSHTAAIEVKYRGKYTGHQVDRFGGHYLKEDKYNHLMNAYRLSGYTPYFVVVFTDYIYMWDLTDMDLEFHYEWMDVTEVEDNGKAWISVTNLFTKDAVAKYATKKYQ